MKLSALSRTSADMMTRLLRFALALATILVSACLAPVHDIPLGSLNGGDSSPDAGQPQSGTDGDAGLPMSDAGQVTPLTCAPGSWCWIAPTPLQPLNAVYAVSATEAWALGDYGTTLHLQNGRWTALSPITQFSFQTISASGPNDIWAIGIDDHLNVRTSTLAHFDGAAWSIVPTGALPIIASVSSRGGETWIEKTAATTTIPTELHRWNGSAFVATPALPAGMQATGVCVRSATEAWATAHDTLNSFPHFLYRFDGTAWSLAYRFNRLGSELGCPADGVAVVTTLSQGLASALVEVRSTGQTTSTPSNFGVLEVTAHNEVFFFENVSGRKWTSTGWVNTMTLSESPYAVDFDFSGATGLLVNGTPSVWRWSGSDFAPQGTLVGKLSVFVAPTGRGPMDPIAAFGEVWAHRFGSIWTFEEMPLVGGAAGSKFHVNAAVADLGGNAWLVGNGIARFDATARTLTPMSTLPRGEFNALDGSDANGFWAVGNDGVVRRYVSGGWVSPSPELPRAVGGVNLADLNLTAVDVRAANDVLILGNDPAGGAFISVFFTWDGSAWTSTFRFGTTISLMDRDQQGNVYIFEGSQVMKRRPASTTWVPVGPVPGSPRQLRVTGPDEIEVLSGTQDGARLVRWNRATQRFEDLASELRFRGVTTLVRGADARSGRPTVWASGTWGSLLHFEPAP